MENNSKKNKIIWPTILGIILIVLALILVIWFFLRGQTTIQSAGSEIIKNDSIACTASNQEYPFFRQNEADRQETKIVALYNGSNLKSISLLYTLYVNNIQAVTAREAQNHAAMNIRYGNDGLDADALSATYSIQEDKMVFSIYAEAADFNSITSKFFLANNYDKNISLETLLQNYTEQGFNCIKNE